jgi:hypothetical protein
MNSRCKHVFVQAPNHLEALYSVVSHRRTISSAPRDTYYEALAFLDFQVWLSPLRQVERALEHDVKPTISRNGEDTYLVSCHRYFNVQLVMENLFVGDVRCYTGRAVGLRYMGEEASHRFLMKGRMSWDRIRIGLFQSFDTLQH